MLVGNKIWDLRLTEPSVISFATYIVAKECATTIGVFGRESKTDLIFSTKSDTEATAICH